MSLTWLLYQHIHPSTTPGFPTKYARHSTAAEQFKCSYLLHWIPLGQTVPRDDLYPSPESNALRPKKALWPGTGVTTAIITSSANKLLIASTAEAIREPRRTQIHCVSNSQRLF